MGMFLINVLGFLGLLMMLSFVASLAHRFFPEEGKKVFYRNRVVIAWNNILDEAEAMNINSVRIALRHRNVSKPAMEALLEYTKKCAVSQEKDVFEDIELYDGFYVAGVVFKTHSDYIDLAYSIKRGDKKYIVRPSALAASERITLSKEF